MIHIEELIYSPLAGLTFSKLFFKLADFWELVLLELLGLRMNDDLFLGFGGIASFFEELSVCEIDELFFLSSS